MIRKVKPSTLIALLTFLLVASSCQLYQKDPVGAALLTIKDGYEETVKTAGRLYINRIIDEPQLRQFRDKANQFFATYNIAVKAYGENQLIQGDKRLTQLQIGLDALQALVDTFAAKKGI